MRQICTALIGLLALASAGHAQARTGMIDVGDALLNYEASGATA